MAESFENLFNILCDKEKDKIQSRGIEEVREAGREKKPFPF